jgi:hypothetical protein
MAFLSARPIGPFRGRRGKFPCLYSANIFDRIQALQASLFLQEILFLTIGTIK